MVLALGTEFDFDDAAPLASVVPGDVSVEAFGTWVRVTLPGIEATRPDAAEDIGDATIVAARTADGVLVADVHAGGPGEYFAQFLSNPARIVIDILPANAAASILAAPLIGEGVVLTGSPTFDRSALHHHRLLEVVRGNRCDCRTTPRQRARAW